MNNEELFKTLLTVKLLKPPLDAVEGSTAGDVVDNEGTDGPSVVSGGDGPESLLAGSVPDLGLDFLSVDFEHLSLEFNADGGLGV